LSNLHDNCVYSLGDKFMFKREIFIKLRKEQIKDGQIPEDWSQKKRNHKDTDANWVQKNEKNHFGYQKSCLSRCKEQDNP